MYLCDLLTCREADVAISRSVEMIVVLIIGDVVMMWLSRYRLQYYRSASAPALSTLSSDNVRRRVECYLLQLAAEGADCWLTRPANRWPLPSNQLTPPFFLAARMPYVDRQTRPDHPRSRESRDSVLIWLFERRLVVFIKLSVSYGD